MRHLYGDDAAAYTVDAAGNTSAGAAITWWSAPAGGTQHTDILTYDGQPPTATGSVRPGGTVVTDGYGRPLCQGPDGVTEMWADRGSAFPRRRVWTSGLAGLTGGGGSPALKILDAGTLVAAPEQLNIVGSAVTHDAVTSTVTVAASVQVWTEQGLWSPTTAYPVWSVTTRSGQRYVTPVGTPAQAEFDLSRWVSLGAGLDSF
jgi:hypothetical protein